MARKGILTPASVPTDLPRKQADRLMPNGAVGALQSSLMRLQESAVQDIHPSLIDDAGVVDRLGVDPEADQSLRESLRVYGQQVPVLVRPNPAKPGRFEIVYGRRRVQALRQLAQPVKAMVRHLDDHALVLAQGQENTARQDLSFIEKASFAAQLEAGGYDRTTIAAALSMDLPMVSRMLKVGTAFEIDFLRHIGSAPNVGRERWIALADAMKDDATRAYITQRLPDVKSIDGSDARFEQVLSWSKQALSADKTVRSTSSLRKVFTPDGEPLAEIKRTSKALVLTLQSNTSGGFDAWLERHAESLLQDLHDRWQNHRHED